ncbi:MAG: YceI family protein [Verrucomicrobiota bacterium]|nr:YceI family protein [Verrucomicrobiota bacterium]
MLSINSIRILVLGLVTTLPCLGIAAPATFKIDPVHSSVGFKIRHFVSKVPGTFADFSGTIVFDEKSPESSKVDAIIKIASVNTNNAKRDGHLQAPDFFDVAKFPEIKFTSTSWKKTGDNLYEVTGNLTMRDVTKPVTLTVTSLGTAPGRNDTTLAGWEAKAKLDRNAWGITYGAPAVGSDVEIEINIEATLQK